MVDALEPLVAVADADDVGLVAKDGLVDVEAAAVVGEVEAGLAVAAVFVVTDTDVVTAAEVDTGGAVVDIGAEAVVVTTGASWVTTGAATVVVTAGASGMTTCAGIVGVTTGAW